MRPSPIFYLPVNPPELSISSVTRATSIHTRSFITLKLPPSLCDRGGVRLAKPGSTRQYFTPTSSATLRLRKEAVSHPKLPEIHKQTADNSEGRHLSGRNPSHRHTGGAVIPQGCRVSAGASQSEEAHHLESVWEEAVTVHGSEGFHEEEKYSH